MFVVLAAPQLKVSDDRLSVTGEKGYSMIRATHGQLCAGFIVILLEVLELRCILMNSLSVTKCEELFDCLNKSLQASMEYFG